MAGIGAGTGTGTTGGGGRRTAAGSAKSNGIGIATGTGIAIGSETGTGTATPTETGRTHLVVRPQLLFSPVRKGVCLVVLPGLYNSIPQVYARACVSLCVAVPARLAISTIPHSPQPVFFPFARIHQLCGRPLPASGQERHLLSLFGFLLT